MPDEANVPEGTDAQQPEGSDGLLEALKERGFESGDKVLEVLDNLKGDIAKYKPKAKEADSLKAKLEEYEKAEEKRKKAEMSELELAQAEKEKLESKLQEALQSMDTLRRESTYKEAVSSRLADKPAAVRQIFKDRYTIATADGWSDQDELSELLDAADKDVTALLEQLQTQQSTEQPQEMFDWAGKPTKGKANKGGKSLAGKSLSDLLGGRKN